ncbi:MAG: glycerophosphoryl diester phosphodiesterase [Thermomicrobiales bacterium]|nr:glycerophosphoryl diester phosphodiesterase [Thermomicrobiales bacterium]
MRWMLRVPAVVVLVLVLNGLSWSGRAEDARWGARPAQFYRPLATELRLGSADVLGIAHDAGDRAPSSQLALAHGADVVEINVTLIGGRLYAAHTPPPGWLPSRAYRGPTLGEAWARTAGARFVQLDLKDTSPAAMRLTISFLERHADGRRVFVSTRSITALETLSERSPDVVRLLSIGNRFGLQALMENPERAELLNGVSVRADLLDAETMAWLKDRGLLVTAWTVNDVEQLNDLVALGIDAVTTDNLAILDAMQWAQQRRTAANLGRLFP